MKNASTGSRCYVERLDALKHDYYALSDMRFKLANIREGLSINSPESGHFNHEHSSLGGLSEAAKAAAINDSVSPHWLRHAQGFLAIERGARLPEVQATLGHGNIATHGKRWPRGRTVIN
jgi:hypothetical protein